MTKVCNVFGAGPPPARSPEIGGEDLVIAVDGGYLYTQKAGIHADVIVGDFDSLSCDDGIAPGGTNEGNEPSEQNESSEQNRPSEHSRPQIVRLPKEKDQTDMFAALKFGLDKGFTRFHIYGGLGGRLDHTLANIQCLTFLLNQSARGYLFNEDIVVTATRTEEWFTPRERGVISVFAIGGPAKGVCLRGLKYELDNAELTTEFPVGVSNEFIGSCAHISVGSGDLLIIYPLQSEPIKGSMTEPS